VSFLAQQIKREIFRDSGDGADFLFGWYHVTKLVEVAGDGSVQSGRPVGGEPRPWYCRRQPVWEKAASNIHP
jgi:hypothetical protein